MNRCETCKHWGENSVENKPRCIEQKEPGGQQRCYRIADGCDDDGRMLNEPAFTYDGEGYLSGIKTRGDFGCVLWEAKQ